MCAIGEEDGGAVFAVLDDQRLGAEGEDFAGGEDEAVFSGEEFGFAVVDEENIDFLQCFQQLGALDVDPEIHGVAADQGDARHFAAHVELHLGHDVGEEEVFGIFVGGGNFGDEVFKDVEVGEFGLRLVDVFAVLASPVEGFAMGVLDAARVNAARGEDGFVLGGEVVSHDADDTDIG